MPLQEPVSANVLSPRRLERPGRLQHQQRRSQRTRQRQMWLPQAAGDRDMTPPALTVAGRRASCAAGSRKSPAFS
jgi:hypothetical protein